MASSEENGGIGRTLAHGLFSLISFLTRQAVRLGITVGLVASVVITLFAAGKFGQKAIKERKEVLDLIYWRDWKKSAVVLCLTLLTLLVFAKFPLILIVSYVSLAVLTGTLGFRLYKAVEAQIKGQAHSNPFKPFLEKDFDLPKDRLREQIDSLIEHVQVIAKQLRRLILVEDIVDSIKFGLLLWALTYVGSWFSGLCLIILAVLGIFSIPKFYEVYQEPIDKNLTIAKEQIDKATNMAFEKVPFLKKFAHEKTN